MHISVTTLVNFTWRSRYVVQAVQWQLAASLQRNFPRCNCEKWLSQSGRPQRGQHLPQDWRRNSGRKWCQGSTAWKGHQSARCWSPTPGQKEAFTQSKHKTSLLLFKSHDESPNNMWYELLVCFLELSTCVWLVWFGGKSKVAIFGSNNFVPDDVSQHCLMTKFPFANFVFVTHKLFTTKKCTILVNASGASHWWPVPTNNFLKKPSCSLGLHFVTS